MSSYLTIGTNQVSNTTILLLQDNGPPGIFRTCKPLHLNKQATQQGQIICPYIQLVSSRWVFILCCSLYTIISHHSWGQGLSPSWWDPQLVWNIITSLSAALLSVVNHTWQADPMFLRLLCKLSNQQAASAGRCDRARCYHHSPLLSYGFSLLCWKFTEYETSKIRNKNVITDYTDVNNPRMDPNVSLWRQDVL